MADARPGAARLAEETRERFLREIVARVPLDRIVELHLFAPIRQGGAETGVAVLAARPADPPAQESTEAAPPGDAADPDVADRCDPTDAAAGPPPVAADADAAPAAPRHTVYTARYRLAIKGPERGRWTADVREEAEAPLVSVDAVVRGVQRRAGDAAEAARLDAAAVARLLRAAPTG